MTDIPDPRPGWLREELHAVQREAEERPELRERVAAHPSGLIDPDAPEDAHPSNFFDPAGYLSMS
jgi:hypothetical protein